MTVNKSRVEKFIKALETTRRKQGKKALATRKKGERGFSFCCLGVACEVAKANGCNVAVRDDTNHTGVTRRIYGGKEGVLPREVKKWYGFKEADPWLADRYASSHNDTFDRSFKEIAKLFREELERGTL